MTLKWTRRDDGAYVCGNWIIERIDRIYRPLWNLRFVDQAIVATSEYYPTLHAAQCAAHGIIRRELLLSFAQLGLE